MHLQSLEPRCRSLRWARGWSDIEQRCLPTRGLLAGADPIRDGLQGSLELGAAAKGSSIAYGARRAGERRATRGSGRDHGCPPKSRHWCAPTVDLRKPFR